MAKISEDICEKVKWLHQKITDTENLPKWVEDFFATNNQTPLVDHSKTEIGNGENAIQHSDYEKSAKTIIDWIYANPKCNKDGILIAEIFIHLIMGIISKTRESGEISIEPKNIAKRNAYIPIIQYIYDKKFSDLITGIGKFKNNEVKRKVKDSNNKPYSKETIVKKDVFFKLPITLVSNHLYNENTKTSVNSDGRNQATPQLVDFVLTFLDNAGGKRRKTKRTLKKAKKTRRYKRVRLAKSYRYR